MMARKKTATREPKNVQAENSVLLDYILNDILTNGLVVQDDEGNLVRTHPSAAHLRVTLDRCRQLALGPVPVNTPAANSLIEEARKRGMSFKGRPIGFPDIDVEAEDHATRTSG